jgi:hypothetical protein
MTAKNNTAHTVNTATTANTVSIPTITKVADILDSKVAEVAEVATVAEVAEVAEVNRFKLSDSYNLSTLNNLAIKLDGSDMSIHFFTYAKNKQDHYFCLVGKLESLDSKKLFSGTVYMQQKTRIATGYGFIYMKIAIVTDNSVSIGNDRIINNATIVNKLNNDFSSVLGKLTKKEVVKAVTKATELKAKREALVKIADAKAKSDYDAMSDTLMDLFSNN